MPRRSLPIGTWGEIKAKRISAKRWEARARFRMADGSYARPRRVGTGKEDASEKLKKALLELQKDVRRRQISPDTKMGPLFDLWAAEVDEKVEAGKLAANSGYRYKGWVKNWVLPRVEKLTARELEKSVLTCEEAIKNAEKKTSKATASRVKVAFGLLCGFAVRHGAMDTNPVKSTDKVGNDRKKIVALTVHQRRDLLAKLEELAARKQVNKAGRSVGTRGRVWADMPNRFRAKLATGVRVGEVIALTGEEIDTKNRTVRIAHHLVSTPGSGVVRMPGRKGNVPNLLLRYPAWSAPMWVELKLRSGGGALFPNADGGWINPTDAPGQETDALKECGYDWVTGHVIRKTVARHLRKMGCTWEQIAAQLGNSVEVVKAHYVEEEVENLEQSEALESLFDDDEETG